MRSDLSPQAGRGDPSSLIQFSKSLTKIVIARSDSDEAIHRAAQRKSGLLRFRLRSLSYGGRVARNDVETYLRILAA